MEEKEMKKRKVKKFRNPKPRWLMSRLDRKEKYRTGEAATILGIDPKNIYELVGRDRLHPISTHPYFFSASEIKNFVRMKPGRRKAEKVEIKPHKRFHKRTLKSRTKEVVENVI